MEYNNQVEYLGFLLESNFSKDEILEKMSNEFKSLSLDLPCGVNFIIRNEEDKILLMRREANVGKGTWALCGGKLQIDETIEETAVRECFEELGIKVLKENIKVISFADTIREERYFQVAVLIERYEGKPKIMEPEKASEIIWVSKDELPDNLFFATKPSINLYFSNKFYDENENVYLNKKED